MSKKCKEQQCKTKTSIGGQALIEGIMMRGPKMTAMAVRNPEGEIVLEKSENKASRAPKIVRLPIIRGVFGFITSMVTGYKCLMRSAEIAGLEDEITEAKETEKAEEATATPTLPLLAPETARISTGSVVVRPATLKATISPIHLPSTSS